MTSHKPTQLKQTQVKPATNGEALPVQESLKKNEHNENARLLTLQPRLAVGASDDPLEREADAMADKIMRMPESHFIQPKCNQCESALADKEEKVQRTPLISFIQRKESFTDASASDDLTHRIHTSLGSGSTLDHSTQSFMQNRFGADFSGVKIHTGTESVQMNRELNAKAFTVGNDIYFNEGQYNPDSSEGKHLLAHELTHTVQQTGMPGNSTAQKKIQRVCAPSICPPAAVEIPAFDPVWREAEKCLQDLYAAGHAASTISFNKNWIFMSGKTKAEKDALKCLKGDGGVSSGYNFTGKSGMSPGEPDIWDFSNQTMYEITTLSGMAFRVGKIRAELALATSITSTMDCGGMSFDAGTWVPDSSCYLLPSGLYLQFVQNNQGVLVYRILKDASKELALAAMLAMLYTLAKKNGGQGLAAAGAKQVAGKAVAVYAVASLAAMAVLLVAGKAKAEAGPGDEEPIVQLFKAMEQDGTPVPKEIQDWINSDPELKQKINEDIKKGDLSDAQKAINDKILNVIKDNPDQFSKEDLEQILGATAVAGSALPKGNITVQEVRKMLDAKGGGQGSGSGTKDKDSAAEGGKADSGAVPSEKDKPPVKDEDLTKKYPKLSADSKKKIKEAPPAVLAIWEAYLSKGGGKGLEITDDLVSKFFSIVPSDLTQKQSEDIIAGLSSKPGATADEIFDSLKKGVEDVKKAQAGVNGQDTGKPADAPPTETRDQIISRLKERAANTDFSGLEKGKYEITWGKDEYKKDTFSASLKGKSPTGTGYVGDVTLKVVSRNEKSQTFVAKFVSTTPFVNAEGNVVYESSAFANQQTISIKYK